MEQERVSIRFHLVGIAIALAVILYVLWHASRHGQTQFLVGQDRLTIGVVRTKDGALAYYYDVKRGASVRVVKTHFLDMGGWWPPEFRLVKGADPDVVGVTQRDEPQVLLILYDCGSGRSWPADDIATGQELLGGFAGSVERGYRLTDTDEQKEHR